MANTDFMLNLQAGELPESKLKVTELTEDELELVHGGIFPWVAQLGWWLVRLVVPAVVPAVRTIPRIARRDSGIFIP